MSSPEKGGKKSFALRLDAEMFAAMSTWAEDELRSVNGQIEYVLREALRQQGRLPKKYRTEQEENEG